MSHARAITPQRPAPTDPGKGGELQPGAVASPHLQSLLDSCRAHAVALRYSGELSAYLSQHPDLASRLPSLCSEARGEFPPPTELSLELYRDPEIDDRYLALYVRQESYEEDLLDRIEQARAAYRPMLVGLNGHFLLTTDFQPPGTRDAVRLEGVSEAR